MAPGSKRPWSISPVLVAQPLLLEADLGRRGRERSAGVTRSDDDMRSATVTRSDGDGRVTSTSAGASRVSPLPQGSGASHAGQVSRASSTGAPHAGHLRAEL